MIVSIVIPSHERIDCLKRLLNSIFSSDFPKEELEIIIVDDSKTFNINKELENFIKNYKNIKILHLDKEISPSKARNIGIKNSTGKYIFLIDDDNIIDKNCINELVKVLENHKDIGIACPFMYYLEQPNKLWCAGVKRNIYLSKTNFVYRNEIDIGQFKELIYSDDFVNAYMIKREVINKVGLLDDKNFPIHYEEADYGERVRKTGYKIVFVPTAKVWHDIPVEVKEKARLSHCHNPIRAYYCSRNRILFYRKHQPKKVLFVFFLFSLWLVAVHHIRLILFNLNASKKEKIKIIRSYLKGIIDGIRLKLQ